MTIASSTGRIQYSGNGTTQAFTVPFYFLADSHLQVVLTSVASVDTVQTITTNYTVSGSGNPAGGTVTMIVAPASGEKLTIIRSVPLTQSTDLVDNDPLPAEVLETALDKGIMIDQQIQEQLDRTIKVPVGAGSGTLPAPQANTLIGWNGTATGLQNYSPASQVTESSNVNFLQSGTGAASRSVQSKLRDSVNILDFGAAVNGTSNDATALQNAVNAVAARGGGDVILPAGTIAIASTITINASGVRFIGAGGGFHTGFPSGNVTPQTQIKWTGVSGGVMFNFTATDSTSANAINNCGMFGIGFNANNLAGTGIRIRSHKFGRFEELSFYGVFNGKIVDISVIANLGAGEARDTQHNRFSNICFSHYTGAANSECFYLDGDSVANTSFNYFEGLTILYHNAAGIYIANGDNNIFRDVQMVRSLTGTAVGIDLRAGVSAFFGARSNYFYQCSTGAGGLTARGTESSTVASKNNWIFGYDKENGIPDPVKGTGASLHRINDDGLMIVDGNGLQMGNSNAVFYLGTNTSAEVAQAKQLISSASAIASCLHATNASYASNIQRLAATRAGNSAFNFIQCLSDYGGTNDAEFFVRGDGVVASDGGTAMTTPADYAEMFEWADGNPNAEDRVGISVSLVGDKIRPAKPGDTLLGIISGNPAVLADSGLTRWSDKYLRDDFNRPVYETVPAWQWIDENAAEHLYAKDSIPSGVIVPANAVSSTITRRKLNPAFDPQRKYVPREMRKEWSAVGLVGKLRLRKGQPVAPQWQKMRDVSDAVEEWLVK